MDKLSTKRGGWGVPNTEYEENRRTDNRSINFQGWKSPCFYHFYQVGVEHCYAFARPLAQITSIIIHCMHYLFSVWPKVYCEVFKISALSQLAADCTIIIIIYYQSQEQK